MSLCVDDMLWMYVLFTFAGYRQESLSVEFFDFQVWVLCGFMQECMTEYCGLCKPVQGVHF
jgi:hypothetical protein